MKLSVAIITLNEEKNIERCLKSVVQVADEIVVVDSLSTDRTESICGRYPVRFVKEKFRGYVQQVNYAMELTTHNFVLAIDADEELSPELITSILEIKEHEAADAYTINRLNNYCGQFIYHGGWFPDWKIRLWNKQKGSWSGENPHYVVRMNSNTTVRKLKGTLNHYSYYFIREHIAQMNKFSDIAAEESLGKGKKPVAIVHLVIYPFITFIKSYIILGGFMDGAAGFHLAISGAYYRYLKYAKLRELKKSQQLPPTGFDDHGFAK